LGREARENIVFSGHESEGKEIRRVKVLWDGDTHEKTWRIEDHMR